MSVKNMLLSCVVGLMSVNCFSEFSVPGVQKSSGFDKGELPTDSFSSKAEAGFEKRKIVVKVPEQDKSILNHKGLLSGFQEYLEEKYDVSYTTDLNEDADIFFVMGFSRPFSHFSHFFKDFFRWLRGLDKNIVSPHMICRDSAQMKVLFSQETWTSFPDGFDQCFDFMLGFDHQFDNPRYMTVPGVAYEYFQDKISTHYDASKDVWRSAGCQPANRKYDVCFLNSNAGSKAFMDAAKTRVDLFHAFSKRTFVASGGKIENNIGYTVPRGDELDWMMNCKFVIAYENRIYPGYITEKPYQAWLAGAIPIYSADRSVLGSVNKDALIYAPDFDSNDQIVDYVMNLLDDKEAYCSIWNNALHVDPDRNFDVLQKEIKSKLIEIADNRLD